MKLKLATTKTDYGMMSRTEEEDIVAYVKTEHKRFKDARQDVEETWLEAWALYLGTPAAQNYLSTSALKTVGDVNTDWRHRVSTGKCFEAVETIHAYLMGATFPNRDWFNATPTEPGAEDNLLTARLIKHHVQDKLNEGKFRSHWETFLRQLLITGNSVIALPWRVETAKTKKKVQVRMPVFNDDSDDKEFEVVDVEKVTQSCPDFEVLDMFDCFFDPNVPNPNDGAFIRRIVKTKADVMNLLDDGYYYGVDKSDVADHKGMVGDYSYEDKKDWLATFQGVNVQLWSPHEDVEIIEYWGDVHLPDKTYHDVVLTLMGDKLLRCETNPYWCGRPFVVGTYIPVTRQPYAMGAVQPNLGMLHEQNIITNQRLDNLEISVDQMYTLRSDGLLQPEDVFTEPGKVFLVSDHDDLRPMNNGNAPFTVTYQESSFLESTIDKNFGTGNYVGANSQRAGERVTAAEVAAVREAGGNRLGGIHKHIEETSLIVVLDKMLMLVQQFTDEPQTVRVAGKDAGAYDYYHLGVDDINQPMRLLPIGSDHVLERKAYIEDRLAFVQAVAQVPEMAQMLDYKKMMVDLLQHWGFAEPEAYMKEAQPAPTQPDPNAVMSPATAPQGDPSLRDIGGMGLEQTIQQNVQADGGASLMAKLHPEATMPTPDEPPVQ